MKTGFYFSDHLGWFNKGVPNDNPLQALKKATGDICYYVSYTNKKHFVFLGCIQAEPILRQFARECALDIIHLWDPPEIVFQYLKTGNESIKDAAWDAAWAAARDAAWAAARDAAWDAAWAVAQDAAQDAAQTKYSLKLKEMLLQQLEVNNEEMGKGSAVHP